MLSRLTSRILFVDVAMAFYIIEVIVSLVQVIGMITFSVVFVGNLSDFVSSADGFLAGVDVAVWLFDILLVAATFSYDVVELPCCLHLIMAGYAMNLLYTLRLAIGLVMWSPHVSAPKEGEKLADKLSVVYAVVSLLMFAIHIVGIVFFGAVAKRYKNEKKRFLGHKEA
ncbi:hypothetical protein QR680_007060 [Steinernema hermaphroditum]|uniref:Uncharacterized protein n=1 Tax=Steinernema hermaphroditum TaxID=289476 RepID=A0AA39HZV9_9BILA|nr:hypothetical protein QR680_007060 [Steinernema hermaphroditum]